MSEVNREHIKRLEQGVEYLTNRIADLQIEINELKEIKQTLDSIESKLKLLVWAKEREQ